MTDTTQDPPLPMAGDEFAPELNENELENPTVQTILRIIYFSVRRFFTEKPGQIIGSTFVLLLLWGTHGRIEVLRLIWPAWRGPGVEVGTRPVLIPGIPWDNELISWAIGVFLLVIIPIILITRVFKQPISDYGLGLPPPNRRRLALISFVFLMVIGIPLFYFGTQDATMRAFYPFFHGPFANIGSFILYELTYLPFFLIIEFIFRGFLLFGLGGIRDSDVKDAGVGARGPLFFARYALLIQMLSYTAWHLGNPLPEVWGTPVWGLAAGAIAYAVRSIWPVTAAHWLLNVFFDFIVVHPF